MATTPRRSSRLASPCNILRAGVYLDRTPPPVDENEVTERRRSRRLESPVDDVFKEEFVDLTTTPVRRPAKRNALTTPRRRREPVEAKAKKRTPSRLDTIPEGGALACRTPSKLVSTNSHLKQRMKCLTSPRNKSKKGTAEFERLRTALTTCEEPSYLPCRENEFGTVDEWVRHNIKNRTSRCMYISGVPGTGKTATVTQVLSGLNDVQVVSVSGMRVTEPHQIFTEIHFQLTHSQTRLSAHKAAASLDTLFHFSDSSRGHVVLVVDELDLLCTRKQHVLYQLFDWATRDEANLSVIAIANTLDLPERLLTNRVASRLGMSRLCFQPYTHEQINVILRSRLGEGGVVEREAVELVSRKVASVSGDLRTALHLCRRAIDIAILSKAPKLTLSHVQEAVKLQAGNSRCIAVQSCSAHETSFLQAAVSYLTSTGESETRLSSIYAYYCDQSKLEDRPPLNIEHTCAMVARLSALRILTRQAGRHDWTCKVRLAVPPQEIQFALKARTQ